MFWLAWQRLQKLFDQVGYDNVPSFVEQPFYWNKFYYFFLLLLKRYLEKKIQKFLDAGINLELFKLGKSGLCCTYFHKIILTHFALIVRIIVTTTPKGLVHNVRFATKKKTVLHISYFFMISWILKCRGPSDVFSGAAGRSKRRKRLWPTFRVHSLRCAKIKKKTCFTHNRSFMYCIILKCRSFMHSTMFFSVACTRRL